MNVQFSRVNWGRVLLISVLLDVLIFILNLVLSFFFFAFLNWDRLNPHISIQVFSLITTVLVVLLTAYCALRVARKVESAAPLHGFLVGLVAALILFLVGLIFTGGFDLVAIIPYVLMVAAGWIGGVLGNRGREQS
jgi:putative membrane protein (TIGR04086 family)